MTISTLNQTHQSGMDTYNASIYSNTNIYIYIVMNYINKHSFWIHTCKIWYALIQFWGTQGSLLFADSHKKKQHYVLGVYVWTAGICLLASAGVLGHGHVTEFFCRSSESVWRWALCVLVFRGDVWNRECWDQRTYLVELIMRDQSWVFMCCSKWLNPNGKIEFKNQLIPLGTGGNHEKVGCISLHVPLWS